MSHKRLQPAAANERRLETSSGNTTNGPWIPRPRSDLWFQPSRPMKRLYIFESHPVQYHAPVYRCASLEFGVPLKVYYGGDFSVRGYQDQEFGAAVKWDVDLLGGYEHASLCQELPTKPQNYAEVSGAGIAQDW